MTFPTEKLRYCWRCRRRLGRGPGVQVCEFCHTYNVIHGEGRNYLPTPEIEERIAYYRERAALGLDLFSESPWRRLPGAFRRTLERQAKLTGTTSRVALADELHELPL